MFDLVTEEMIGWGEDDENEGDPEFNKARDPKIDVLNSDLQDIFANEEDECEGCIEGISITD